MKYVSYVAGVSACESEYVCWFEFLSNYFNEHVALEVVHNEQKQRTIAYRLFQHYHECSRTRKNFVIEKHYMYQLKIDFFFWLFLFLKHVFNVRVHQQLLPFECVETCRVFWNT